MLPLPFLFSSPIMAVGSLVLVVVAVEALRFFCVLGRNVKKPVVNVEGGLPCLQFADLETPSADFNPLHFPPSFNNSTTTTITTTTTTTTLQPSRFEVPSTRVTYLPLPANDAPKKTYESLSMVPMERLESTTEQQLSDAIQIAISSVRAPRLSAPVRPLDVIRKLRGGIEATSYGCALFCNNTVKLVNSDPKPIVMPSIAVDQQTKSLIGGARKVARCSECTRPLGHDCSSLLCSRCTTPAGIEWETAGSTRRRKRSEKKRRSKSTKGSRKASNKQSKSGSKKKSGSWSGKTSRRRQLAALTRA